MPQVFQHHFIVLATISLNSRCTKTSIKITSFVILDISHLKLCCFNVKYNYSYLIPQDRKVV